MAKIKIARPNRDPDHYSKRRVPYWWAPEFIRGTSADSILDKDDWRYPHTSTLTNTVINTNGEAVYPCASYGKIHAIKENGTVNLYMKSKDGNLSYIQGSIQDEFKRWHTDRSIDYLLFGLDPDEILSDEND